MTSPDPDPTPPDLRNEIAGHLMMIEAQYPLTIHNKDQVTERILARTDDMRQILTIALSLNHWAAVNGITGDVEIPEKVLDQILRRIR